MFAPQQQDTQANPFGQNPAQKNEKWKADRFLNFSIPTEEGELRLAAAGLKLDDPNHKQLIDWLDQNPEENAKILVQNVICTYRDAKKKAKNISFIK